jgi:hypothetical protein
LRISDFGLRIERQSIRNPKSAIRNLPLMDPDQQRIEEDLRGLLQGEVRCDDVATQLYASDASIYELKPLGVVRPRTVDDVVAAVRYAGENNLPIHARGAGTGLAGESLGRGLVLDFSRYFRRIVADEESRVRVQPGVVLASLNRFGSLLKAAGCLVPTRPREASPRWAASWRSTPVAATGRVTVRPASMLKSCKSFWLMRRCFASAAMPLSSDLPATAMGTFLIRPRHACKTWLRRCPA